MAKIVKDRLYKEIGKRIKAARKEAEITQAELADRTKIPRGSLANMEVGHQKVALDVVYRIAFELKLELADLLPTLKSFESSKANVALDGQLKTTEREWLDSIVGKF